MLVTVTVKLYWVVRFPSVSTMHKTCTLTSLKLDGFAVSTKGDAEEKFINAGIDTYPHSLHVNDT